MERERITKIKQSALATPRLSARNTCKNALYSEPECTELETPVERLNAGTSIKVLYLMEFRLLSLVWNQHTHIDIV